MLRTELGHRLGLAGLGVIALVAAGCSKPVTQLAVIPPKDITETAATLSVLFTGNSPKEKATLLYRRAEGVKACPSIFDVQPAGSSLSALGWTAVAPDPSSASPGEQKYGQVTVGGLTPDAQYIVCAVGMVGDTMELAVRPQGGQYYKNETAVYFSTLEQPAATPVGTAKATTATATGTAKAAPSPSATVKANPSPSATPGTVAPAPPATATQTATTAPTATTTPEPTPAATPSPTPTPSPSPSPTPSATPTASPTPTPTSTPTDEDTQQNDDMQNDSSDYSSESM